MIERNNSLVQDHTSFQCFQWSLGRYSREMLSSLGDGVTRQAARRNHSEVHPCQLSSSASIIIRLDRFYRNTRYRELIPCCVTPYDERAFCRLRADKGVHVRTKNGIGGDVRKRWDWNEPNRIALPRTSYLASRASLSLSLF